VREIFEKVRRSFYNDFTEASLKTAIIAVALFFIFLALVVNNKWLLAAILAYIVLP
jgi:hypothetical protein